MDIVRIATAGSVDDGKSTLIGRLLYETGSIPQDRLEAVEAASRRKGLDFLDLSLLTDGLIAEREQGITIDVAHIYFSTPRRKYIIADTPGHFEYTRNMVTGASTSRVSLILIDARHGVVEQTFRHFFIASLLRMPRVIVCINKMDLVGYDQGRFLEIKKSFEDFAEKLCFPGQEITFIPLSSLHGVNLTAASAQTPWYGGPALLEKLEAIGPDTRLHTAPARFVVQGVVRPKTDAFHDFRGFSGRVASGSFALGDTVVVLPSGQQSTITGLQKYTEQLAEAGPRESVVISLADDVDCSRGNMLTHVGEAPEGRKTLAATVCWLGEQPLRAGQSLVLQHGTNDTKAKADALTQRIDVQTLETTDVLSELSLNQIGRVQLRTARPIFADRYADNPANGAFILIDPDTHATVGVGFVA